MLSATSKAQATTASDREYPEISLQSLAIQMGISRIQSAINGNSNLESRLLSSYLIRSCTIYKTMRITCLGAASTLLVADDTYILETAC